MFEGSDMYQKIRRQGKPLCPYCKVRCRGVFTTFSSWDWDWLPKKREPVALRKPISKKQRLEIMQKYGGKCALCGSTENLQIDHIIPVIYNGTNDADNLQVLCKACNTSKGPDNSISKYRVAEIEYQKRAIEYQKITRESIIQIKQSCSHLTSKKQVSLKEISRVSGVEYAIVLDCRDEIRKELGLSKKKSSNTPENATVVT